MVAQYEVQEAGLSVALRVFDEMLNARVMLTTAQPGEILVSDVVRQLAAGKDFLFSDRGETVLRGFEEPVRLYELRWREQG